MARTIKSIFDDVEKDVKFDAKLAKRIERYVNDLMNRNEDHVKMLGSCLTGVYPLRFKTSDKNEWFIDIKDIDEFDLQKKIIALAREKDSGIMESWVRATDAFNLDCLYTMHRFLNSNLPDKVKKKAVHDTAMALNLKLLGSIMANYFKYDVDELVAQEVYSRLSRKFFIKRFGHWRGVLEHRSMDIVDERATSWLKVLTEFTDNTEIAQCISDVQGRLRSMIKYIWEVFDKVRQDEAKFNKTSMSIVTGGEKILAELSRDTDKYKNYALTTAMDENSFIKPELITLIGAEMPTMPVKLLTDCLVHTVEEMNSRNNAKAENLISNCVEHTVQMIQGDRTAKVNLNDLSWILNKSRLLITAPKTSNQIVFEMRETAEKFVRASAHTRNNTLIMSLRTGLILYIIARTFSMHHYSK